MRIVKTIPALVFAISTLSSCGGDMYGWPYCSLPIRAEDASALEIRISHDTGYPYEEYRITDSTYYTEEATAINSIYEMIQGCHRSPSAIDRVFHRYWFLVDMMFSQDESDPYRFEFYSLGVTNGFFVFDEETTYRFKGDFLGLVRWHLRMFEDSYTVL